MQRDWHRVDYYAVLGVAPDATQDEITQAFHRLARQTHPDAHPDEPTAEERFKRLSVAYEVLDDPSTRAEYDRVRGVGEPSGANPNRPSSSRAWAGPPDYDPDDDDLWETWPPPRPTDAPAGTAPRRGKRIRPRWLFPPYAFVVIGGLLIGTGLVYAWQQQNVPAGWLPTTARVIATADYTQPGMTYRQSHKNFRTIEYRDRQNRVFTDTFESSSRRRLGDTLSISYDPDDPIQYEITDVDTGVLWVFLGSGAVLLLVALLEALFTAPRRRFPLRPF